MNAPSTPAFAFPPSEAAAWERLRAADPAAYARRRNYVDGPVTRLSPYLTHGVIDLPEAVHALRLRHRPAALAKLEFEFAWREYFQHVWRHLGAGILEDVRPPAAPVPYLDAMPADVVEARTGVPVVDQSVRELYGSGYLHNHQRMWLASYVVHVRKVAWRAGADWMYPHLLDGDLASNHLSWQWVAGTLTGKPYLFNSDNVARYAPALASRGTVIDAGYGELARIARGAEAAPPPGGAYPGIAPPPLHGTLPNRLARREIPPAAGKRVRLVHPWELRRRDDHDLFVGLIHLPFHRRFPWSEHRWSFVFARMAAICDAVWVGDGAELLASLGSAAVVSVQATLNPGYRELTEAAGVRVDPVPRLLPDPDPLCRSFSKFWELTGARRRRERTRSDG